MRAIWKFPLPVDGEITAPVGARVLSVQTQNEEPFVWALVDPNAPQKPLALDIYGSGHLLPDDPGRFVGTIQMMGDTLIFHVFQPHTGAPAEAPKPCS